MPSIVTQVRNKIADAQKQLEALEAERAAFADELTQAETEERAAIQKRGGIAVIQAVQGKAAAIRAASAQTETEIAQLLEQLPVLEDELERENRLHEMQRAAGRATEARSKLDAALSGVAQIVRTPLGDALAVWLEWDQARADYDGAGREVIAGYRNAEPLWDQKSPERRELEDLLRRRGHSVKEVTEDAKAAGGDPYLDGAWLLLQRLIAEHQRVQRAEEAALGAESARRAAVAAEERERRLLTVSLTVPAARANDIAAALASLQVRSSTEFQQRLPGTAELIPLVRIGIPQPDKEEARGLLYAALGKEWTVENVLFADDERAYYLR